MLFRWLDAIHIRGILIIRARLLIEWNRVAEEGVNDVRIVVKLLVNRKSENAHLSSATVVELNSQLLLDGLLIPTGGLQLSLFNLVFTGSITEFNETNECNKLSDSSSWDVTQRGRRMCTYHAVIASRATVNALALQNDTYVLLYTRVF